MGISGPLPFSDTIVMFFLYNENERSKKWHTQGDVCWLAQH
ncbi:Hypothetical protein ABZS17I87_02333 [Kosakonia cowanii]